MRVECRRVSSEQHYYIYVYIYTILYIRIENNKEATLTLCCSLCCLLLCSALLLCVSVTFFQIAKKLIYFLILKELGIGPWNDICTYRPTDRAGVMHGIIDITPLHNLSFTYSTTPF